MAYSIVIPNSAFRTPHLLGSQSVISSARRFAKAEVRGANPRESAMFQDRGVIAASLPVKETVRVQIPAS